MCTQYRDFFTAFEAAIMLFYGYDHIKFVYFSFTLKQTLIVTHGHQLKKNLPVRKTTDNATWNEHVYKKNVMDHQVFKLFSCTLYRKLFWKGFFFFFVIVQIFDTWFAGQNQKGK